MPADEILGQIKEYNLYPYPTNLAEEMSLTYKSYKEDYGDDTLSYPKDVKAMMMFIQELPGYGITVKEVMDLVNDQTIRKWIHVMALGNIDPGLIYVLVSSKTDKLYDEGSFYEYINYFFNLEDFTIKEKYELAQKETNLEQRRLFDLALKYEKDELLWELGFTPDLSVEFIVKGVAAESYMKFKHASDEDKSARLGALVLKAVEKLKELDAESKKNMEDTGGLNFEVLQQSPSYKLLKDVKEEEEK